MFRYQSKQDEFILGFCIIKTNQRDFDLLHKDPDGLILRLCEDLKKGVRFYDLDEKQNSGPFDFTIFVEVPRSNLMVEKKVIKLKSQVEPVQIPKITCHIDGKEKTIKNPCYFSFESSHIQNDIAILTPKGIPLKPPSPKKL